MTGQPVIEFWYEFASTYSYPAALRAESIAQLHGVSIAWCPFLLGPIFRSLGWDTSPFNLQPAKGAYMWRDLQRVCVRQGLPFQRPASFPQNGLMAARIATALPDDGARAGFSKAVYDLEFAQGADISEPDMLKTALESIGQNSAEVLKRAQSTEVKSALRAATDTAQSHGIFGAPTWRTGDGEIFWGNDRLEDAVEWALAAEDAKRC